MREAQLTLMLFLFFASAGAARAQQPSAARCASSAEPELRHGLLLRRANRPDEALTAFRCALTLGAGVRALVQVALAEKALGRWLEAFTHLSEALTLKNEPYIAQNQAALAAELAVVESHLGALEVVGEPQGAAVHIDGRRRGDLPLRPLRLAAGVVTLRVHAAGFLDSQRSVTVPAGVLTQESVVLRAERPRGNPQYRRAGWALGGLGVVGLLVGGAAQTAREVLISRYNDDALCLADLGQTRGAACGPLRTSADTAQVVAWAGWAAGGALAVGSLALLIAGAPRGGRPSITWFPVGRGLGVAGAF